MKDKPTKWGIKVLLLTDDITGYTKRIDIYTEKNKNLLEAEDERGLTMRVVLDLMKDLEHYHNKLFLDRFYSSPSLFIRLYRLGVNACGTAMPNHAHYPTQLRVTKQKK